MKNKMKIRFLWLLPILALYLSSDWTAGTSTRKWSPEGGHGHTSNILIDLTHRSISVWKINQGETVESMAAEQPATSLGVPEDIKEVVVEV
jgi:hypothetical protein